MLTPKKKYNPLSEQENIKSLTLIDFAHALKVVCPENLLIAAVPNPDTDSDIDLIRQQTDEVTKYLCRVSDWISNSTNVDHFFANLFVNMALEKISKI